MLKMIIPVVSILQISYIKTISYVTFVTQVNTISSPMEYITYSGTFFVPSPPTEITYSEQFRYLNESYSKQD